jgi:peptidoglycan hydrolase-like protein with peptidoglycan-binding domain
MNVRRSFVAVVLTSATAFGGVVAAAPGASASTLTPAVYGCNYTNSTPTLVEYSPDTSAVKEAQCLLKYWGFNPGSIDGSFGPNTLAAVEGFQGWLHISCGLAVDGIVGPATWHALKNSGC